MNRLFDSQKKKKKKKKRKRVDAHWGKKKVFWPDEL